MIKRLLWWVGVYCGFMFSPSGLAACAPQPKNQNIMYRGRLFTLGICFRTLDWQLPFSPGQGLNNMCGVWMSKVSTLGLYPGSLEWQLVPPNSRIKHHAWWLGVVSGCPLWVSTLGLWAGSLTSPEKSNIVCGGWVSTLAT